MGHKYMGSGSAASRPIRRPPWLLLSCPIGRLTGAATEGDAYADGGGAIAPPL